MGNQQKKSRWKIIAGVILILQLLFGIVTVGILVWLNLLPAIYLALTALILLFLLTVVYYFFYSGVKNKKGKLTAQKKKRRIYWKRSIGCFLSALTVAFCSLSSVMLMQAGDTLNQITNQVVVTDTVSVYVLKDNPAVSVADAADYVFATAEKYDPEHTKKTVAQIEDVCGKTIQTQSFDDMLKMVDALYAETVDAIILNVAYVDAIEAQDEYGTFSQKTKTLYDHEVESVITGNETEEKSITEDPFVVYLSGSDTRNYKLSTSRSDVNILVVVNPSTKQVLMINTPRDYYVDISICPGAKDKLTHCGMYGIDCSMDTLSNFYDEPVDYYAQINFSGFETLVDAVGGITVESEKSFYCSEGGYYIAKGTNQLNGTVALSYVRERKSFADGDNARGRHQMQAIEAIIEKVSSGTTVLSRYSEILDSMEGMFSTDMSSEDIASLVRMQLSEPASWNVKSFAVTGKGGSQTTYSIPSKRSYVMYPDETQIAYAKLLIDKVKDGVILTEEDMVVPSDITE